MTAQTKLTEEKGVVARPPVVVILGHVDHGKSSILEAIKDFKITAKESGGITQHVGAYEIEHGGKKVTFIDTPGHEAFSAMRSRGASIADIAVLVVAAEEGVKLQTKEAISFAKKAGIPIMVAINKIDKPGANPEQVKRELSQNDILVESMGGKVPAVEVSAKTGQGIDNFLEMILLLAEMENLTADISKPAEGAVVESYLDSLRGPTVTLLVRKGILKKGNIIATPFGFGRVKILENFQGIPLEKALPSMPCIVVGLENVPPVGEKFKVCPTMEAAKQLVRVEERKATGGNVFFVGPSQKVLNLILKADVVGSSEAIEDVLKNLPQEKVVLRLLEKNTGEVNESDVKLALASKSIIIAFRVKTKPRAQSLAQREKIKIMTFEIIYELVQKVRQLMERILEPEIGRRDLGRVNVLAIFRTEKNRQILGGRVTEGEVKNGALVEVFRNKEMVGKGKIVNLQRAKKEIETLGKGEECGILYQGDGRVEERDILQVYMNERRKEEL